MDIDEYEKLRPPRRTKIEMHMGGSVRMFRLMREQGFSMTDIRKAAKAAAEIRKQRDKTISRFNKRNAFRQQESKMFSTSKKKSSSV